MVDCSLGSMTSGFFYTTGSGITEGCIYWWKFECPVWHWTTLQPWKQVWLCTCWAVHRRCWVLSSGVYTNGNVSIWQKLLHGYLLWGQSLPGLKRGNSGNCATPLRLLAKTPTLLYETFTMLQWNETKLQQSLVVF